MVVLVVSRDAPQQGVSQRADENGLAVSIGDRGVCALRRRLVALSQPACDTACDVAFGVAEGEASEECRSSRASTSAAS